MVSFLLKLNQQSIVIMIFRNLLGIRYELHVPLDAKFREITDLINNNRHTNDNITYVSSGHTISVDATPTSEGLSNNSEVFIVCTARPAPPATTPAPPATTPAPPATTPAPDHEYVVSYNGEQIRQAMNKSTHILLNVVHMIGHQNPFFLSYLAVNPTKALEHLDETLDQSDFKFIVKGNSVEDDPIKPFLVHPCGENGYQIDQNNISFIIEQCPDYVDTEESREHAKETYLLMDRDIRKTIDNLRTGSSLIGS